MAELAIEHLVKECGLAGELRQVVGICAPCVTGMDGPRMVPSWVLIRAVHGGEGGEGGGYHLWGLGSLARDPVHLLNNFYSYFCIWLWPYLQILWWILARTFHKQFRVFLWAEQVWIKSVSPQLDSCPKNLMGNYLVNVVFVLVLLRGNF